MTAPVEQSTWVRKAKKKPALLLIGGAGVILLLMLLSRFSGDQSKLHDYYEVTRSDFLVTVVSGSTLEAVNETVIRNEVDGTSRVIKLAPEGSYVKKGDLLVELDSAEAEERLNEQSISYEKAKAAFIQAEKNLEIQKSVIQSEVDAAQLAVEFAQIDLEKFISGEQLFQKLEAENAITTVQSDLLLAEDELEWSEKLYEKGFETKNALDQSRNKVLDFELKLQSNQTNLWMLQAFDFPKLRRTYESALEEAKKELDRVIAQGEGKMAQYVADLITESNTLVLNEKKLQRDTEQLAKSKIYAPQDGLVVYAMSRSRYSSASMIEEGAQVSRRQELIKLPDISQMKVEIKVHESHVNKVQEGQRAFVILDSYPDERFKAEVSKVALLADSQSRYGNPNLKEYKTEVLITDELPDVKPNVSARAEIIITNIPNAITVPIQAVTTVKGQQVVYLKEGGGVTPTPVEVGLFNTKFIEVLSGIEEGDEVLLSPPFNADEQDLAGAVIASDEELSEEDMRPNLQSSGAPRRQIDTRGPSGPESTQTGGRQRGSSSEGLRGQRRERESSINPFDANGDGQIDDTEREAMRDQFGRNRGNRRGNRENQQSGPRD